MMVMVPTVMVVVLEHPRTGQVHDKADDCDGDGLAEVDGDRAGQAQQALPPDQQGNQGEDDGAREAGEIAELARAEGEARIAGVTAGVEVRQGADQHGGGMGGHVPAVGHQRHRAVDRPGDDLDHKAMPTMGQAGVYSSILHYLKAIEAAGTDEAQAVAKKMKDLPVNDFFAKNGRVREDGRMVHDLYVFEVKKPEESREPWDYLKLVRTIPGDQAFRPLSEGECLLIKDGQ